MAALARGSKSQKLRNNGGYVSSYDHRTCYGFIHRQQGSLGIATKSNGGHAARFQCETKSNRRVRRGNRYMIVQGYRVLCRAVERKQLMKVKRSRRREKSERSSE